MLSRGTMWAGSLSRPQSHTLSFRHTQIPRRVCVTTTIRCRGTKRGVYSLRSTAAVEQNSIRFTQGDARFPQRFVCAILLTTAYDSNQSRQVRVWSFGYAVS